MKAVFKLNILHIFIALFIISVFPTTSFADGEENTVRTSTYGNKDSSQILEAKIIFDQMINTIKGNLNLTQKTIDDDHACLEDVRRQINNLQTVIYRARTVYIDRPVVYAGDDGGDDGGGDGGGGDGGGGGCEG